MTHSSDALERFRRRLHADPGSPKNGLFGQFDAKRVVSGLAAVLISGVPGIWWLVRVPTRAAKVELSCNEMQFNSNSPITLSVRRMKAFAAYGVKASIADAASLSITNATTNAKIDLNPPSLELQDAGEAGLPALKVDIDGKSGPFIAAFSNQASLRKLVDPEVSLEVSAARLKAMIDADQLSINADRLIVPSTPSVRSINIMASNPATMTRLQLEPLPARKPSLVAQVVAGTLTEITPSSNTEIESTFLRCHKVELAIAAKKISLPSMSVMELTAKWTDLKAEQFSVKSETAKNPEDMSLIASGNLSSVTYNGEELNYNNLRNLTSLSTEKQGLIGVLTFALLWLIKQIFDRVSKRIFDQVLPER